LRRAVASSAGQDYGLNYMPKPVAYIANHLRQVLVNGASAPHTAEVQRFFKDEISSRGWYTDELRKLARRFTKVIKGDAGVEYLVAVADSLFHGKVLEEKILAVQLLETSVRELGPKHFDVFEGWLERVSTWADHDALVSYLIGPMLVADRKLAPRALRWAQSSDRWHRRAAAVAFIRGVREKQFENEIRQVANALLEDEDDMVRKGLGWLLREAAKYHPEFAVPLLMKIRDRAPRLVLRAACETLPPKTKTEIMGKAPRRRVVRG